MTGLEVRLALGCLEVGEQLLRSDAGGESPILRAYALAAWTHLSLAARDAGSDVIRTTQGEITEAIGAGESYGGKAVRLLMDAGFLSLERRGRYRLHPCETVPGTAKWLEAVQGTVSGGQGGGGETVQSTDSGRESLPGTDSGKQGALPLDPEAVQGTVSGKRATRETVQGTDSAGGGAPGGVPGTVSGGPITDRQTNDRQTDKLGEIAGVIAGHLASLTPDLKSEDARRILEGDLANIERRVEHWSTSVPGVKEKGRAWALQVLEQEIPPAVARFRATMIGVKKQEPLGFAHYFLTYWLPRCVPYKVPKRGARREAPIEAPEPTGETRGGVF